ncbi:MAG: alpha/beta fold hydrolase [Candidatus Micrarchaeia archaeon]
MDIERDFIPSSQETSEGNIYFLHHVPLSSTPVKNIVFLHGVGANSHVWKKVVELMPESIGVDLLDLLGHGMSDAPRIDYTVEVQAKALRDFLSSQKVLDAILVGHSYGGWISAYYSSIFHELGGMLLEDPAGIKEQFDDIISQGMVSEYKSRMLKQLLNMNGNKDYVMESILNEDFAVKYQLSEDTLSKIRTKCALVWGENDELVNPKYAEYLLKWIKGSTLEIIEGAGHASHYTHAQQFYEVLKKLAEI